MSENLTNACSSDGSSDEITTPRDFYDWANRHTKLCAAFAQEKDCAVISELKDKIDNSLAYGKLLLDSLNDQSVKSKPLIPISGISRLSQQPRDLMHAKEILSKNTSAYSIKSDIGIVSSIKTLPLPSKTYLKKKTQS